MASLIIKEDVDGNAFLQLTDSGLTTAAADLLYLRLDAINSPLTGTLNTRLVQPNADDTYNLGATALRWNNVYGTTVRAQGGTISDLSVNKSCSVLGHVYKNGATGTARLRAYVAAANYNSAFVFGDIRKSSTTATTVEIAATASGAIAGGHCSASAGPAAITASNIGTVALGRVRSTNADGTRTELLASVQGALALGNVVNISSGYAVTAFIEATAAGAFAAGSCNTSSGYGSYIRANGAASFAAGHASAGGRLLASGQGSFAHGNVTSASLQATNIGAFANGNANYYNLTASGVGSFASGFAANSTITAGGNGAFAVGYATSGGAISASANNSAQFGPGTNSVANTMRVGTAGLHLKGTVGAFATPANGQMWMGSTGDAFVQVRSNAVNVTLGPVNTWTTGAFGTQRNLTTRTASIGTLTTTGATSDFAIQGVTAVTPFGFVNADEGNTLVNSVANLQTRVAELWEVLETVVEDLRVANII